MNTVHLDAAPRAALHDRRTADEESNGESLSAHAKRVLRARLSAAAGRILNAGIALLQRLLARVGAAPDDGVETQERRSRPSNARRAGARDDRELEDETQAEPPVPQHRLRSFLTHFGVLLCGGMAGGALAYELLAIHLERQAAENQRVAAALAKQSKAAASNRKELEQAKAKLLEVEKKPVEADPKLLEAEKKLAQAEAKRIEAENRLEAYRAESSKVSVEKQKKLGEALKILESVSAGDRSGQVQRSRPASYGSAGRARPAKSGDCALGSGNVSALTDCLKEFNR